MIKIFPIIISVLCGAGHLVIAQEKTFSHAIETAYTIQPLDKINIAVFREEDISKSFKVSSRGYINHPLLGTVKLAGFTIAAAEIEITELLAKDFLVNPQVNITIDEASARHVIVLGAVKEPGSYNIPPDQKFTLTTAIAHSGGFKDVAAKDKILIIRTAGDKTETHTVDMKAYLSGKKASPIPLKPGDVVTVPEVRF